MLGGWVLGGRVTGGSVTGGWVTGGRSGDAPGSAAPPQAAVAAHSERADQSGAHTSCVRPGSAGCQGPRSIGTRPPGAALPGRRPGRSALGGEPLALGAVLGVGQQAVEMECRGRLQECADLEHAQHRRRGRVAAPLETVIVARGVRKCQHEQFIGTCLPKPERLQAGASGCGASVPDRRTRRRAVLDSARGTSVVALPSPTGGMLP